MNFNEDQCLICHNDEEGILIDYLHICGRYKMHQKCLDEWFLKNVDSCIICRESILDNENNSNNLHSNINIYNNLDTQSYDSIDSNNSEDNILEQYHNDNNNKTLCSKYFFFYLIIFWIFIIGLIIELT